MKILFLGDASMAHYNLALGLKRLGHETLVISEPLRWRQMPQDITLERKPGRWGAVRYLAQVLTLLPRLRGYDVVQLVGPNFLALKKERLRKIYDYLRRHNKCVVLSALGDDYYWVHGSSDLHLFRYGDFNIGDQDRRLTFPYAREQYEQWSEAEAHSLNEHIARTCNAITPISYEYYECYRQYFVAKTHYMPLPIVPDKPESTTFGIPQKVRIFIGIQRRRSQYKGTDIMLQAAQDVVNRYPTRASLTVTENLPYSEYVRAMEGCDILLDQLYSYTPGMNGLIGMSKGLICVGGGEPELYELEEESELRPIINVWPTYESVFQALEQLVLHPEQIPLLKKQSVEYIMRHHHYKKVAKRYEALYESFF